MHTHYHTLGISPGASALEIRKAYRRQMRVHHPDRGARDGGARAAELNLAYKCLSDFQKKREYDRMHGFTSEPQFEFKPVRRAEPDRSWRAPPPGRSPPPTRTRTFPIKWIALLAVLLTLPLVYGIVTNGY